MSAAVESIHQQSQNGMRLVGRIEDTRRLDQGGYEAIVTMPAASEYDRPQTVIVRSDANVGRKGEEIDVSCVPEGYARKYHFVDKKTGEERQGWEPRSWFRILG